MILPDDIQRQYDFMMSIDPGNLEWHDLPEYKLKLDALYEAIEALEPDEADEDGFLEWEELLETLDDCYDDYNDLLE